MLAAISDDVLITLNTIEIVALIYLAIWIAKLSERLSRIEGRFEEHDNNPTKPERRG